ncbi:DUF3426 domain-containing protein [Actimicrobium sp. CCI2.3]|uniref:DUF3426 domain-containing protein n=1 Tax=Actimicrobium sp. CCI2.3 TaxID=3048616 RepID=UPI002AB3D3D5|nr:DUF3426 domain-containing protein [Actimicrobium sp. CCI2.3]MDY7573598.1 DUF3426 domain-containing protein [Actimicrobium sp. CCI2.3]
MALATQCPHCQTTFRVAHDQLKLRAGLVRCGSCKQIFNGIEHLLRPGEAAAPKVQATPAAAPDLPVAAEPAAKSVPAAAPRWPSDADEFYPAFDPIITPPAKSNHEPVSTDPLQRMTLLHLVDDDDEEDIQIAAAPATDKHFVVPLKAKSRQDDDDNNAAPDELDQAILKLQQHPWRSSKIASSPDSAEDEPAYDDMPEEPSFVTHGRRRQRLARSRRLLLVVVAMLLVIAALGQAVYLLRDQIAARLPSSKPLLERACMLWGCRIELLAQASQVSIESSELITLDPKKTPIRSTCCCVTAALCRNAGRPSN